MLANIKFFNVKLVSGLFLVCLYLPMSHAANLADVYQMSKASDPKYKAARHELDATGYVKDQALAGLLPTVSFERTQSRLSQEILSTDNAVFDTGNARFTNKSNTLTINQPIFRVASWLNYKQAGVKVQQAAATFSVAENDLILRTATAYIDILAARDAFNFANAERDAIKSNFELAEARYKNGLASIVTLHDAKARYALKEADVVVAQNLLLDKLQALGEITGEVTSEISPLRSEIPLVAPMPNHVDEWIEMAEKNNPLLEARRHGVSVALKEVEKQRSGHYPTLDLVASRNRADNGGSLFGGGSVVDTDNIMLRFTLPIYSGGLITALTAETNSRYEVALADLERDWRQIERQVRSSYQAEVSAIGLVEAFSESVGASESARTLKVGGFESGINTMLAVLDAERDLYAAKRDLAKARYDFLLNGLRLKQAAGILNEADLMAVNEMLQ
jgi:outer membrane protein